MSIPKKPSPVGGDLKDGVREILEAAQENHTAIWVATRELTDLRAEVVRAKQLISEGVQAKLEALGHVQGIGTEDHREMRATQREVIALLGRVEQTVEDIQTLLRHQRSHSDTLDDILSRSIDPDDLEVLLDAAKRTLHPEDLPWYARAGKALQTKFWEIIMGAILITILRWLIPIIAAQNPQIISPPPQLQTAPSPGVTPTAPHPKG